MFLIIPLWRTVHTDTQCSTLNWLQNLLFLLLCKVTWSLSWFVLPSVCHVTVNIADYSLFHSISVCLTFTVPFCT